MTSLPERSKVCRGKGDQTERSLTQREVADALLVEEPLTEVEDG